MLMLFVFQLMSRNCLMGVSLVSVRGEHSSGLQQFQHAFGELDESRWMDHVRRMFPDTAALKKHSVTQHPALTPEQSAQYKQLVNISHLRHSTTVSVGVSLAAARGSILGIDKKRQFDGAA